MDTTIGFFSNVLSKIEFTVFDKTIVSISLQEHWIWIFEHIGETWSGGGSTSSLPGKCVVHE